MMVTSTVIDQSCQVCWIRLDRARTQGLWCWIDQVFQERNMDMLEETKKGLDSLFRSVGNSQRGEVV